MKTYVLEKKIEKPYLVVNEMGNPEIRAIIDAGPVRKLVVNDGSEDNFGKLDEEPTEEQMMKMKYEILVYETPELVIYWHFRRLRPVKLCVYRAVNN